MKKTIREKLRDFAIWLLDKTDREELKSAKFDYKMEINWNKYLAKKDKWYHLAATVEMFMRRSGKNVKTMQDIAIYVDGKETHRYRL